MIGVGSQVLGNVMGINNAQQMNAMQMQGQRDMAVFNRNQQMQLWRDTNYKAQAEEMRKAGLNVGLMYGKGGGGGATAAATPGNVSAQSVNNTGGNALQGMAMASQANLNKAQIENIQADTAKKGAEKTEIESRTPTYAKGMEKTDQEIAKMASDMGVNVETMKKIVQEVQTSKAQQGNLEANTQRTETLTPLEAEKINSDITSQRIENELTKSKTNLTNEQIGQVKQDIINSMSQLLINRRNATTAEKDAATREWESNTRKVLQKEGFDVQTQGQILNFVTSLLGIGVSATKPGTTVINY